MRMILNMTALFGPPRAAREEAADEQIVVNPIQGGPQKTEVQEADASPGSEGVVATADSPQEEQSPPIVVVPDSPVGGAQTQTPQSRRKKVPCLQLPVYPEGAASYHKPRTIEEYKALLVLATRSTWTDTFSEADYLKMERWVGVDKYRPKVANRICTPVQGVPKSNEADSSSGPVEPATSDLPTVVVPADPGAGKSQAPAPRPRGTYY